MRAGSTYSQKAKPWKSQPGGVCKSEARKTGTGGRQTDLGRAGTTLFDEVEGTELAETLEELHDLVVGEVAREAADEDLVDSVGNVGRDDAGNVNAGGVKVGAHVVLGSTDLERIVLEDDAVESKGVRGFFAIAELEEGTRVRTALAETPQGRQTSTKA